MSSATKTATGTQTATETKTHSSKKQQGYHNPPWTFTGKALYQLSLVRVRDARKYVPDSIPLVNIFGWTLGGFYLARYENSPAGSFDELVALAGLAWNFPTSCAWAARVYVNSEEARRHGLTVVGLPSRLAKFERRKDADIRSSTSPSRHDIANSSNHVDWWCSGRGARRGGGPSRDAGGPASSTIDIYNVDERNGRGDKGTNSIFSKGKSSDILVCSIDMSNTRKQSTKPPPFMPSIQMFLPSFSGATALCPDILKYSLRLCTKVSFLKPLSVSNGRSTEEAVNGKEEPEDPEGIEAFVGTHVLGGKPLVCMCFEDMRMDVEAPEIHLPAVEASSDVKQ